ncbi:uroporphyrinogen-III synthase [Melghiribacillus thermohalophilus]|uniref:Uroporphyrinogen-III synthase n=1 Tax=Melghiribacillus thermohalophilus TaxID=1324956 RepID=A0A4R3NCE0_9BACI|nr:uroporphyrinogen-III synthase [Melghiribacillus thermohalophilus]TCT27144.1 uroporphyrinogen-III synthase [Melghiribacillus thermohalophilus]
MTAFPLENKRILVTRGKKQSSAMAEKIKAYGGIPVEVPLLTFDRVTHSEHEHILKSIKQFDWIVFTSVNGVKYFFEHLNLYGIPHESLLHLRIASIGAKTSEAVKSFGLKIDFEPGSYHADTFGKEFLEKFHPDHILFVRGNLSRPTLPEYFKKQQVKYTPITVYQTIANLESKDELQRQLKSNLDVLTFTSPSSIDAFFELGEDGVTEQHLHTLCLCIGPTTRDRAIERGFVRILVPGEYTAAGMIHSLVQYFRKEG